MFFWGGNGKKIIWQKKHYMECRRDFVERYIECNLQWQWQYTDAHIHSKCINILDMTFFDYKFYFVLKMRCNLSSPKHYLRSTITVHSIAFHFSLVGMLCKQPNERMYEQTSGRRFTNWNIWNVCLVLSHIDSVPLLTRLYSTLFWDICTPHTHWTFCTLFAFAVRGSKFRFAC